jgi:ribosomal protein L16 Arg81 hydroxylase
MWAGGQAPRVEDVEEFNRSKALVIRGGQRYFSEIASFLATWRPFFNCRLNANVYLTHPKSSVFDTHYDPHHVFAVQVDGDKDWFLWPPTIAAPHSRYQFEDAQPKGDPIVWRTRRGDLLYIPLGWVHRAQTAAERSVHVTVGVNPPRWLDLIEQAVDQSGGEISILRSGLPFRFSPNKGMEFFADPDRHLAPIIALLTKDLAQKMQARLHESK